MIRAKGNRNVIYKGKSLNIKKVAALKDTELTIVIVRGYGINPTMIITNLDLILLITIGFLALFSNQQKTKLRVFVKKVSERIFDIPDFEYYALAEGIREILAKSYTGIASFLNSYYKKRRSQKKLRLALPL